MLQRRNHPSRRSRRSQLGYLFLGAGRAALGGDQGVRRYMPWSLQAYHTRASAAWAFGANGVLQQYAANVLRVVPSPAGVMAALREPQSTNYVPNNSMAGVAAGTPGTLPTGWGEALFSGISRQVVGSGIENGVPYVDVRLFGNAAGGSYIYLQPNGSPAMPCVATETGTGSAFVTLVAGSAANLTSKLAIEERTSAGIFVTQSTTGFVAAAGALGAARQQHQRTMTDGTTTNANVLFRIDSTGAIDATFRIGAPGLEKLPFATSPILTTGSQVTRARDEINIPMTVAAGQAHSQFMDFVLPAQAAGTSRLTGDNAMGEAIEPARALQSWNGAVALNTASTYTLNARGKAAWAGDATGRSQSLNAGVVVSDANLFGALTRVLLGQQASASDSQSPVLYIHEFRTYRRRLSNAELQRITA